MSLNLEEKFKTHCNTQNLELNPNQITLVKQLDNFYKENFRSNLLNFFSKQSSKKGFYLYGGVGVGKTMILDFFFNLINKKKTRIHFNQFMLNFHDFVHKNKDKNEENIISLFVNPSGTPLGLPLLMLEFFFDDHCFRKALPSSVSIKDAK